MSAVQTTLPFAIRKKSQFDFYSNEKKLTPVADDEIKRPPVKVAQPAIKKIVELDSDDENVDISNIRPPVRKVLKRRHVRSKYVEESTDESDCSPTKISRAVKNVSINRKSVGKNLEFASVDNQTKNLANLRLAMHTDKPMTLSGREKELERLTTYLDDHLDKQVSGTLYISGPPGTGKTACLTKIIEEPKFKKNFTEVYVNCTTMKSAGSIFNRICQELHLKTYGNTEKAYLKAIDKHLAAKHKMILLVLDEIDQLCNKKQSVLYTIFEWPSRANSKIVLIGIANALDLTDRTLPRLQGRLGLQPELMHFAPYTKQQIIEIFTERLKQDMNTDLFSPVAIQMLAGKVAAVSGDVRRALDIGRRVIELASPRTTYNHTDQKPENKSGVELKRVMSVLSDVYGTSQKLETDLDDSFPLQQKILLCSLLLLLTKAKNKDVTVGRLHDVYKKVCSKRNILAVDSTEFFSLCGLVETRGIIKLSGKKEARLQKVILQWVESEVTQAMSDKKMISEILNDQSCI